MQMICKLGHSQINWGKKSGRLSRHHLFSPHSFHICIPTPTSPIHFETCFPGAEKRDLSREGNKSPGTFLGGTLACPFLPSVSTRCRGNCRLLALLLGREPLPSPTPSPGLSVQAPMVLSCRSLGSWSARVPCPSFLLSSWPLLP